MASTVERRDNGEIIYRPAEILDIPNVDLITLLFGMCKILWVCLFLRMEFD